VLRGGSREAHSARTVTAPHVVPPKPPTVVLVLKARAGAPAETVRLPGFQLRLEPDRRWVVLHRHGSDIACISTDELECWSVEPE
jgi:hypothetical protein